MEPLDGSYLNGSVLCGRLVHHSGGRLARLTRRGTGRVTWLFFAAACACNARPGSGQMNTWTHQSVKRQLNWLPVRLLAEQLVLKCLLWNRRAVSSCFTWYGDCGLKKKWTLESCERRKKTKKKDDEAAPAITRIHISHISKPYNAIVCFLHCSHKISQSISFCLNSVMGIVQRMKHVTVVLFEHPKVTYNLESKLWKAVRLLYHLRDFFNV